MMAFNVQLQSSLCCILLRAVLIRTRVDLLTNHSQCNVLTLLVCQHVLLQMLLIEEPLPAVRFGTHTVAHTVCIMDAHVDCEIALPIKDSADEIYNKQLLITAGEGASISSDHQHTSLTLHFVFRSPPYHSLPRSPCQGPGHHLYFERIRRCS